MAYIGWAFWGVGMPLVLIGALFFEITELPSAVRAAGGKGAQGSFLAEDRRYDESLRTGTHCSGMLGTFTSDDGSVVFKDAVLANVCNGVSIGDRITVLYEGHRPYVYLATGSKDWIVILGLMLAGLIYLALWVSLVRGRLRRKRPVWMPKLLWGRPGDPLS